jgi:TRAP transporter 4TM/12TM fusion protein
MTSPTLHDLPPRAVLHACGRWLAIGLGIYHLYTAAFGTPVALVHRAVHFGGMALLAYLVIAGSARRSPASSRTLAFLGILAAATGLYLVAQFRDLITRVGFPLTRDLVVAGLCVLLVLDLARRIHGWPLVITASAFLLYGYAGPLVPGFMGHRGYATVEILEFLYTTTEGLFGVPIQVSATYLVIFIMFAAFLERAGISALFNDLAFAAAGRSKGGVGKVAVLSSALMGTVSGSGLANVTTTGAVTIPMMKRHGFQPHYAAAVEATASMGGQIMPPVMGVAAFLMAERLNVPYSRIALAAIVPALLYFLATAVQIHLHASRLDVQPAAAPAARRIWTILASDGYLLFPIGLLIAFLFLGYSPIYAAIVSMASTVVVSCAAGTIIGLRHDGSARERLDVVRGELSARAASPAGILGSIEIGIRNTVSVAVACAVVGIIVGIVLLTGAGLKLSSAIVMAAGGMLAPTLVLAMLACFLLGLGLPTIPTYIITSTMAAPALTKLGVDRIAADFFVMYFGVLANITPPVALAAYAAAGIAGANPLRTSVAAVKLSIAGFIVPYVFVYSPIMLGVDFSAGAMVHVVLTSVAGVVALGAAMEGYLIRVTIWYERGLLAAAAIVLIVPGLYTDLAGAILSGVVVLSQMRQRPLAVFPGPGEGQRR